MTKFHHHRRRESGNILIYILGAIFLLGLLTIAVKGSNSPGAGIDEETLMIRVTEVQSYGEELARAVTYVLANGHSESDIRFAHPDGSSAYGLITDIPTRQVFSRDGGGAKFRSPPNGIQTTITPWFFTGANRVSKIGSDSASANSADLVTLLQNVTEDFCIKINEKNSITNPAGAPPQDGTDVDISTEFVGTFTSTHLIEDTAGGLNLQGKHEGCFEGGGSPPNNTYHYYRVLLAR